MSAPMKCCGAAAYFACCQNDRERLHGDDADDLSPVNSGEEEER